MFFWTHLLRDDFVERAYASVETNLVPSPPFPVDELVLHGEGKVSICRLPLCERWIDSTPEER